MSDVARGRAMPRPAPRTLPPIDEPAALPLPDAQRIILMTLVVVATIMQFLDSTIANVALPHMQASLGATPDTISWVLTSYIVAAAIATPVTGWLAERFGRRALIVAAIAGFTAASALCGVATSLPMMVAARLLQGLFGAFVAPLAQSLMLDINPRRKHSQAMMIWGMASMIAPVMGPVLGGWLTDSFDWRWVFFINVPIGIVVVIGLLATMPRVASVATRFDLMGFVFLFMGVGALQLMLDRGDRADWFESTEIWIETAIAVCGFWMFAVHTATAKAPLLPAKLFRDRNLMLATLFVLVIMGVMIASAALLPPLLQRLFGYDAYGAGMLTAPRGVAMMISMLLAGRTVGKVDPRVMMLGGLTMTAWSLWLMTGFTLEMGSGPVLMTGFLQGIGFGFVVLPLNMTAFATLAPADRTQAAGLYNLSRNMGGSMAISLLTTLLSHQTQVAHSDIAAHVTEQSPLAIVPMLSRMGDTFASGVAMIDGEVNRQAVMISYLDGFYAMFWGVVAVMPLVLLLKPAKAAGEPVHMSAE